MNTNIKAQTVLEDLIAAGKIERALAQYTALCREYSDDERAKSAILQASRFSELKIQKQDGLISQSEYQLESAKIKFALVEMAGKLPVHWVIVAPAPEPPKPKTEKPKRFLEKWGLILGIAASLTGILGISLRDIIFPKKEPGSQTNTQPQKQVVPENESHKDIGKAAEPVNAAQEKTARNPKIEPPAKQAEKQSVKPEVTAESNNQPDNSGFKSLRKIRVVEDMERGKIGDKFAFRNVKTRARPICCYDDADDFSGGKAYVKRNGQYFYINKAGHPIKE